MEMQRIVVALLVAGLLATACSSGGGSQLATSSGGRPSVAAPSVTTTATPALVPSPIAGCVPICNKPGLRRPGPLPDGPYKTQWFFGSEMVITTSEPWSIHEDSTGEFALTLDAQPDNSVLFWEDVYPIEHDKRVPGVPLTAEGLLAWLKTTSRLGVSAPRRGSIGSNLPATVVDVTVANGAKNEDPGCPSKACILWLDFPQWDDNWGIAEPQVQRFYLSNVSYGGKQHLFVAVVYPDDPRDMKEFLTHAKKLIASVKLPATAA